MDRRTFLKLLAASLASAGVTGLTIAEAFAGTDRADKMSVAVAIRRLAKRYGKANGPDRERIAYLALRVMAEAHRDYSLAWAGGAVTYFCHLTREDGNSALYTLARNARVHRDNPNIAPFLGGLRDTLLGGPKAEGDAALLMHESYMAFCEMGEFPISVVRERMMHGRYLQALIKHHPAVYARDYPAS